MHRFLVIYASAFGQTQAIATKLAERLRLAGHTVELADVRGRPPGPEGYDAVVLGSRVQAGKHAAELVDYVRTHREPLAQRATAFFSVSMSAATPSMGPDPHDYVATFLKATGWTPGRWIAIAGGLPYRKFNPFLRLFMKFMSWRGGHSTDTSRNHEYTDWGQVARFADDLASDLETSLRSSSTQSTVLPASPSATTTPGSSGTV
ncbi:MAG: protoporphyrinogen oxidase [Kofleriaceae bacterium]|nr:MAG: protoporphyrinogen oxidase [Kofleriaceae bacterium]